MAKMYYTTGTGTTQGLVSAFNADKDTSLLLFDESDTAPNYFADSLYLNSEVISHDMSDNGTLFLANGLVLDPSTQGMSAVRPMTASSASSYGQRILSNKIYEAYNSSTLLPLKNISTGMSPYAISGNSQITYAYKEGTAFTSPSSKYAINTTTGNWYLTLTGSSANYASGSWVGYRVTLQFAQPMYGYNTADIHNFILGSIHVIGMYTPGLVSRYAFYSMDTSSFVFDVYFDNRSSLAWDKYGPYRVTVYGKIPTLTINDNTTSGGGFE